MSFIQNANNNYDYLIVGAGIVGLTVARELKKRYPLSSIVILEKEPEVGMHASGRNSGVMHSGVYYGSNTLKARFCTVGASRMRDFAAEHRIACSRSGKVIIATSDRDLPTLDRLLQNAKNNGVNAERLDEKGIKELEPYASPYMAGIYSPDTAVIDSKSVVNKLRELLEQCGVKFVFNAPMLNVSKDTRTIRTPQGSFSFGFLYNCAGSGADLVAKKFGLAQKYTLIPFKGIYFKIRSERAYLVRSNIYPVPDPDLPFLGVHLTRVISDDVYVGPTAIPAFGRENYGIFKGLEISEGLNITSELFRMYMANNQNFRLLVHTEAKKYLKRWFFQSAQTLMSELKPEDLIPCNKVGIRPQLINRQTHTLEMDYLIEKNQYSLHVLNSISPAFTSSLAFSEWIVDQVENPR